VGISYRLPGLDGRPGQLGPKGKPGEDCGRCFDGSKTSKILLNNIFFYYLYKSFELQVYLDSREKRETMRTRGHPACLAYQGFQDLVGSKELAEKVNYCH